MEGLGRWLPAPSPLARGWVAALMSPPATDYTLKTSFAFFSSLLLGGLTHGFWHSGAGGRQLRRRSARLMAAAPDFSPSSF